MGWYGPVVSGTFTLETNKKAERTTLSRTIPLYWNNAMENVGFEYVRKKSLDVVLKVL